jgi:hypothetical protein
MTRSHLVGELVHVDRAIAPASRIALDFILDRITALKGIESYALQR